MEMHHELTGYLRCGDTRRLVDAIVALCEREGLRLVDTPPVPVLAPVPSRKGLFSIAVLPGAPGWHVLLSDPEDFLCERAAPDATTRFVDLCNAVQSPGFFAEVDGGDAVYGHGAVTLEADGRGNHAVAGLMWRPQYGDDETLVDPHLSWRGYTLDPALMYESFGFRLIADALPADYDADVDDEDLHSDIVEAMCCGHRAHHLGGPSTRRYWRPELAWSQVQQALSIGGHLAVPGGILLTFAPASMPNAATPTEPVQSTIPAAARDRLGFSYADGAPIRRGDEVRLGNGDTARITALLERNGARGPEPGGVCVDGIGGNFVIDPLNVPSLQLIRRAPPEAAPLTDAQIESGATAGDAKAQYAAGLYHKKNRARGSLLRAAAWFRKAAEQGHAAAQFELGHACYLGEGEPEDWRESHRWVAAAAAQGQPDALRFLVNRVGGRTWRLSMYRSAEGLPEDIGLVAGLLEQLAQQGDESAQFELGQLYASGLGVERDLAKARHWYGRAAGQGHAESRRRLDELPSS